MALGATPARVSIRARACAHARCRVFSGRRGGAASGIVEDALIVFDRSGRIVLLKWSCGNSKLVTGTILGRPGKVYMAFKRNLVLSVALGIAGGLAAYALAWGLFTTHPELGMESRSALTIAAWIAPLVFLGSLIYFAVREGQRR
jgi:hypothetical protein